MVSGTPPGENLEPGRLSESLRERLRDYDRTLYRGVHPSRWNQEETYLTYLGENRIAHEGIRRALAHLPRGATAAPLRLLDLGCGLGGTLRAAAAAGCGRLVGLEPDPDALTLCRELLGHLGIQATLVAGRGEELPFASDTFDLVTNLTILEHVQDPERVLAEALRVLRPGGVLYTLVPNARFPWEGHYRMVWLPMFPRTLARGYLRLRGRDPRFLDHLQDITPARLLRAIRRHRPRRIIDLSGVRLRERLEQPGTLTTPASRRLVMAMRGLPVLGPLLPVLATVAHRMGLAYPLVLVVIR
jgi:ubiquinone/menaquinone biosynthesis C-methylase UbiE